MSVSTRTRPYWPGRRMLPGLGKAATMRMVPVFASTCRSASRILPVCGYTLPSLRISLTEVPKKLIVCLPGMGLLFFCARRYSCSLIGKKALMGSTCETEVNIDVGPTRLPIWRIRQRPVRQAWPEPRCLIGSWRWPGPRPAEYHALRQELLCQAELALAQDRLWRDRASLERVSGLFRKGPGLRGPAN